MRVAFMRRYGDVAQVFRFRYVGAEIEVIEEWYLEA